MTKFCHKKDGFTLLELMISAAIMVGAILVILALFVNYLVLMETSKNTTVAVDDAQAVLETIRNTDPFTSSNIIAIYPAGVNLASNFGFNKLQNEAIYVSCLVADPLQITVTVNWQEKRRNRSESLTALMTQR